MGPNLNCSPPPWLPSQPAQSMGPLATLTKCSRQPPLPTPHTHPECSTALAARPSQPCSKQGPRSGTPTPDAALPCRVSCQ